MKTLRALAVFLASALMLTLVSPVFAADKVTIRLMTRSAGTDPNAAFLDMVKKEFLKTHPEVTIQDDSIADEPTFNNKLKIDIATGNVPSIFTYPAIAGLVDWAKAGVLMDVTPLFADKAWSGGFIPGTTDLWNLEKYGVKGRFAVPRTMAPEVIYYNADLFAKAGITSAPKTVKELYAAIDKLKAAKLVPWAAGGKDGWRVGHIFNNVIYRTVGVDYIKNIGARSAKWTDSALRPAFAFMKDLVARGAFEKGFMGLSYDDERASFFAEKSAMTTNGTWFLGDIAASAIDSKIKFMAFPYFDDKPQFKGDSILFAGGYQLSGKMTGAEKDAAIAFIKFLTSKDMTTKLLVDYNQIGARNDMDIKGAKLSPIMTDMVAYMGTITNAGGDFSDFDPDPALLDRGFNAVQGLMIKDSPETAAKAFQAEVDKYEQSKKK